jgi:hypothetical protein
VKRSLIALATLVVSTTLYLPAQPVGAQAYAPGQAVEVDITGINNWEGGTVVPFLPGDSQDGYQVRVKVPRYSLYPDGFMVQKIHMRPGAAAAAPPAAQPQQQQQPQQQPAQGNVAAAPANQIPQTWEPVHNPRPAPNPWAAQPAQQAPNQGQANQGQANQGQAKQGQAKQGKFNAGDRVEIDKAKINSWELATVLPFEGNDPRDGSFYRIRIDGYTTTPHGMLVPVETLRAAAGGGGAKLTNHKIGDRVDAQSNGKWYSATIVEKRGIDEYKVHYDGWDAKWDEWVDPARLKGLGQGGPARGDRNPVGGGMQKASTTDAGMKPQMNNGVPNIPGTGWDMMSIGKHGEAPSVAQSFAQSFAFSKDGRWSVARYGLAAGQMGTYKIQGNRLIMTNSLNGEIFGNYAMNWKAGENLMELDDGKWILRLKHVSNNAYGGK